MQRNCGGQKVPSAGSIVRSGLPSDATAHARDQRVAVRADADVCRVISQHATCVHQPLPREPRLGFFAAEKCFQRRLCVVWWLLTFTVIPRRS